MEEQLLEYIYVVDSDLEMLSFTKGVEYDDYHAALDAVRNHIFATIPDCNQELFIKMMGDKLFEIVQVEVE